MPFLKLISYLSIMSHQITNQKQGFPFPIIFSARSQNYEKASISFVMSVHPSLRMEHLGSHWMNFHQFFYLGIFRKSFEKIRVSLKSGKNNGYFA